MDKLVHASIRGFTSSFRIPLIVSGNSLCAPVPSYSTLLGLIGCCVGRNVYPQETRIGFEYSFGSDSLNNGYGVDTETSHRLILEGDKLKPHPKGPAPKELEFHAYPKLELYLDNLDFYEYLRSPIGIPTLGRSQDLVWISNVEIVDVHKKESGFINGTLIPFPQEEISSRMLRLPEYFDNTHDGVNRVSKNIRLFQIVSHEVFIHNPNLYQIVGNQNEEHVIYLHEWDAINGKK
jgi:CRISPR-associated protein Cas5t